MSWLFYMLTIHDSSTWCKERLTMQSVTARMGCRVLSHDEDCVYMYRQSATSLVHEWQLYTVWQDWSNIYNSDAVTHSTCKQLICVSETSPPLPSLSTSCAHAILILCIHVKTKTPKHIITVLLRWHQIRKWQNCSNMVESLAMGTGLWSLPQVFAMDHCCLCNLIKFWQSEADYNANEKNLGQHVETSLLWQCACTGVGCLYTDSQTITTQQDCSMMCQQLTNSRHCIA